MSERIVLRVTLENRNHLRSFTIPFAYVLQSSIIQYGSYHLWAHSKYHINAWSETLNSRNGEIRKQWLYVFWVHKGVFTKNYPPSVEMFLSEAEKFYTPLCFSTLQRPEPHLLCKVVNWCNSVLLKSSLIYSMLHQISPCLFL